MVTQLWVIGTLTCDVEGKKPDMKAHAHVIRSPGVQEQAQLIYGDREQDTIAPGRR